MDLAQVQGQGWVDFPGVAMGCQKANKEEPSKDFGAHLPAVDWNVQPRLPFTRHFIAAPRHEQPTAVAWRQALGISIEDKGPLHIVPAPIAQFEELGVLPAYVLEALRKCGITAPLPIQSQALPLVLSGCDVVGIAQTGSGKTLAFLLPAIVHIEAQQPIPRGCIQPIALILAPTRELAVQIVEEAWKVLRGSKSGRHSNGVWATAVYGGGKKHQQLRELQYGSEIVAATPGRLIDFLTQQSMSLDRVTYLVLDEAGSDCG